MTVAIGATSYASAYNLKRLSEFLSHLNEATRETGWRTPSLLVSLGEGEEEIVVGVRWVETSGYVAEIR